MTKLLAQKNKCNKKQHINKKKIKCINKVY